MLYAMLYAMLCHDAEADDDNVLSVHVRTSMSIHVYTCYAKCRRMTTTWYLFCRDIGSCTSSRPSSGV